MNNGALPLTGERAVVFSGLAHSYVLRLSTP